MTDLGSPSSPVRAWLPRPDGHPLTGLNGQVEVYTIYDSSGDGGVHDVAYADGAAALIVMKCGAMSAPHFHRRYQVNLVNTRSRSYGALTLAGHELEYAEWIRPGGFKIVVPDVPHVAIYPDSMPGWVRGAHDPDDDGDLHVIETKGAARWQDDTYPRVDLHRQTVVRLAQMDLLSRVDLPEPLQVWVHDVTGRDYRSFRPAPVA